MANENDNHVSRRKFLKNSGYAAGGVVGGALLGGLIGNPFQKDSTDENDNTKELLQEARTFFSRAIDFETLAAATERIYPKDDQGPGAIELGVPYFIDKQLASFWGSNGKDYTKGPFKPEASDTHGLQLKLNRGDMFLIGLRRMQEVSQEQHKDNFSKLEPDVQDEILQSFESGDIKLQGMKSDIFFNLLRHTTIEGVYSDPVYGGNKDMQGWKMMEYPGPHVGWADEIESEDFLTKEAKSLRSYQGGGV